MIASRSRRRIRRSVGGAVLAVGVAAASACSAGQLAQTSRDVPAIPGVNASAGPGGEIALRNVLIVYDRPEGYPAGASAPLEVRIFNNASRPIRLVRATAEGVAERVELVSDPKAGRSTPMSIIAAAPEGSPTSLPRAGPSGSAQAGPTGSPPTGSPQAGPTSSRPATAGRSATGQADVELEIAPGSYLLLVPGQGAYLRLAGLTRALTPGTSVPVTFVFGGAVSATVRLTVPFGPPTAAVPRETPVVPGEDPH